MAGSLGSSAAVTWAGGSVTAAALTCIAYLIGVGGYALLICTRSSDRDHAGLLDATVISTGVGMLAWVFLASPYSADDSLPLVERGLSVLYVVLDVLLASLAGASLMAPAILAIQALRGQRIDVPVIVAGCALLFLLVRPASPASIRSPPP